MSEQVQIDNPIPREVTFQMKWAQIEPKKTRAIINGVTYDVNEVSSTVFSIDVAGERELLEPGRARTFFTKSDACAFCIGLADGTEPGYTRSRPPKQLRPTTVRTTIFQGGTNVRTLNWEKKGSHLYEAKGDENTYIIRLDKASDRYVLDVNSQTVVNESDDEANKATKEYRGKIGESMKFYFLTHIKALADCIETKTEYVQGNRHVLNTTRESSTKEDH